MKVGFTGTQNGMTAEQLRTFGLIIKKIRKVAKKEKKPIKK